MRPACSTMNRRFVPSFAVVRKTGCAHPDKSGTRETLDGVCARSSVAEKINVSKRLQCRPIVAGQEDAAYYLDWNASLLHEIIVKVLKAVTGAFRLPIIITQLVDLELAQRV